MFETEVLPDGCHIRFSASLPLLDRAVAEAVAFLKSREAVGSLFDVRLLLREALLNAVVHGSLSDPLRRVSLELTGGYGAAARGRGRPGPGI